MMANNPIDKRIKRCPKCAGELIPTTSGLDQDLDCGRCGRGWKRVVTYCEWAKESVVTWRSRWEAIPRTLSEKEMIDIQPSLREQNHNMRWASIETKRIEKRRLESEIKRMEEEQRPPVISPRRQLFYDVHAAVKKLERELIEMAKPRNVDQEEAKKMIKAIFRIAGDKDEW